MYVQSFIPECKILINENRQKYYLYNLMKAVLLTKSKIVLCSLMGISVAAPGQFSHLKPHQSKTV